MKIKIKKSFFLLLSCLFLTPSLASNIDLDAVQQQGPRNFPSVSPNYSKYPKKIWLYSQDPYFRESMDRCLEVFDSDLDQFLKNYSYMIIKPDAIAKKSVGKLFEALKESSLEAVLYKKLQFTRDSIRLMWFYDYNPFPLDRFTIADISLCEKESIFLLLKNTNPEFDGYLCNYVSDIKGKSSAKERSTSSLRYRIGAKEGDLTFIHTPDEPIDVIREIGVLFYDEELVSILRTANANSKSLEKHVLEQASYENSIEHDLSIHTALASIRTACNSSDIEESTKIEILLECDRCERGEKVDWMKLVKYSREGKVSIPDWDLIVFSVHNGPDFLPVSPIYK